jgi:spore cortex formation protein SpoVR/YcgB (stage V sporulation)
LVGLSSLLRSANYSKYTSRTWLKNKYDGANLTPRYQYTYVNPVDYSVFQKQGKEYKIVDKQWEEVRDQLVSMRVNGGFPYITVNDADYMKNGELYLNHSYEDMDLM